MCNEDFQVGYKVRFNRGPRRNKSGTILSRFTSLDCEELVAVQVNSFGMPEVMLLETLRLDTQLNDEVTFKIIYPNGDIYDADKPYQNSAYGLDQLVQVKITKRDGKIIRKEIV